MEKNKREGQDASLGYKLALAHWLDTAVLNRLLKPLGLKRGQVVILAAVLQQPGIVQDELNALQGTDRAATSRSLKKLEKMELVVRCENTDNGRQKIVFPTPKARSLSNEFFSLLIHNNEILFKGFSPEERSVCLSMIDRVIDNLREKQEG